MNILFTGSWWKAATMRALRTAAVIAIPYVPVALSSESYLIMVSAAGLGAVLSYLTSLAGLAEVQGTESPWYFSLLSRVVKTTSQALIVAVGSAVFIQDVNWATVPALVASSAIGSALLFFTKGAPEVPTVTEITASPVAVVPDVSITPDVDGR